MTVDVIVMVNVGFRAVGVSVIVMAGMGFRTVSVRVIVKVSATFMSVFVKFRSMHVIVLFMEMICMAMLPVRVLMRINWLAL